MKKCLGAAPKFYNGRKNPASYSGTLAKMLVAFLVNKHFNTIGNDKVSKDDQSDVHLSTKVDDFIRKSGLTDTLIQQSSRMVSQLTL